MTMPPATAPLASLPAESAIPVAVVGAGPAGLMAASALAEAGWKPAIFDAMASPGRKLLMAGRGGLNLTHSEPAEPFLARYGDRAARLAPMLAAFTPADLRAWAAGLGIETFVGSSGRVFPVGMKASPLLRAWLRRLADRGATLHPRHRLAAIDGDGALGFETPGGLVTVHATATVLALGGASWPSLGADGRWSRLLADLGLDVAPLRPANCGFQVAWSGYFASRHAGRPLTGVAIAFGGRRVRGEAMITRQSIEGGAIYALSAPLRDAVAVDGSAVLAIDLRPELDHAALVRRLARPRGSASLATHLTRTLKLSDTARALLHEAGPPPADPEALARLIKALPITLTAPAGIERAISTAGGVRFESLDDGLMARSRPGLFLAGEMLDWEAPTGGYLLQACLASGRWAGGAAARWLAGQERAPGTGR